jgi:hypothetical protein
VLLLLLLRHTMFSPLRERRVCLLDPGSPPLPLPVVNSIFERAAALLPLLLLLFLLLPAAAAAAAALASAARQCCCCCCWWWWGGEAP